MPSNSAFADLGRIMFPSDNPFEYPTQPMTTLENHAQHDQSNPNPMRRPYLGQFSPTQQGQAASTQSHQFDPSLDEVQLYALPPYFIQGQQGVPGFGAEFQSDSMDVSGPSAGDMMGMWSGPEPEGDWAGEAKHWNFPPGYGQ